MSRPPGTRTKARTTAADREIRRSAKRRLPLDGGTRRAEVVIIIAPAYARNGRVFYDRSSRLVKRRRTARAWHFCS